jgi:hypothetical protein
MNEEAAIVLGRTLDNQQNKLLLQRLFNAGNVPKELTGAVRDFQEASIEQGFENHIKLNYTSIIPCIII